MSWHDAAVAASSYRESMLYRSPFPMPCLPFYNSMSSGAIGIHGSYSSWPYASSSTSALLRLEALEQLRMAEMMMAREEEEALLSSSRLNNIGEASGGKSDVGLEDAASHGDAGATAACATTHTEDDDFAAGVLHLIRYGSDASKK
jgi:hypothetical protein